MKRAGFPRPLLRERVAVLKPNKVEDQYGSHAWTYSDEATLKGRRAGVAVPEEVLAHQLEVLEQAVFTLEDRRNLVGPEKRLRDSSGKVWEVEGFRRLGGGFVEVRAQEVKTS